MPIGERLFRVVWLGPPGRAFITLSSRGVVRGKTGATMPGVTRASPRAASTAAPRTGVAPPPTPVVAPPTDHVASLEARIAALERWRDGVKP
jgi:hypothetical protein